MQIASIQHLIAISTFSVYDYLHLRPGTLLDETSPLEANPKHRDDYAQTKLLQEELYREFAQQGQVTLLRPGMIYGRDNLWNPCLGAEFGDRWLRIGSQAQLPLIYVENCAEAIVMAAETPGAIAQTLNLVDDDLPTQEEFVAELNQRIPPPPCWYVSWPAMHGIAQTAWLCNRLFFSGHAKLPGILVPARLQARFKPLRYTNAHAKTILNWSPRYTLSAALDRCTSSVDLLDVSRPLPVS
jgi:nucleoside-diphosphate-sugar epimerase